jgi:hypothetical protein
MVSVANRLSTSRRLAYLSFKFSSGLTLFVPMFFEQNSLNAAFPLRALLGEELPFSS